MINIGTSVVINQSVDTVFDFVTAPGNDEQWFVRVKSCDHTPNEPAGIGSTS